MDSEQSARVLLIGGVALLLIIALAFVGFGYWYAEIRPEGRTVLQLDDEKVSFAEMKRRMSYELFQNVAYQQNPQALPQGAYDSLVEELLVTKRSESALNITATEQELDAELKSKVGVSAEADGRAYAEAFRTQLELTGLHEDEYRRLALGELLEEKITERFKTEAPENILQA
jgi:hypothetical protein